MIIIRKVIDHTNYYRERIHYISELVSTSVIQTYWEQITIGNGVTNKNQRLALVFTVAP